MVGLGGGHALGESGFSDTPCWMIDAGTEAGKMLVLFHDRCKGYFFNFILYVIFFLHAINQE